MHRFSFRTLALFGLYICLTVAQNPHHNVTADVFAGISPSVKIEWHDCYDVFKCARLIVPAKVERMPRTPLCKRTEKTVTLAIIKLPYIPGPDGPARKGAVHVAMGGWSSSSTNFLVRFGEDYAPLFVGYDLIAIDYRGWGWTTPPFRCFATEAERQAFAASEPALLGYNHKALSDHRERAEGFASRCKKNGGAVAKYMGTYANAVDHYYFMKLSGDTKMSFWGVSSGTHLGQTIALLYPDVVDKFFFDSVVPSYLAYTITTAQPIQIQDSEKALEAFFYTCLQSSDCALKGGSTTTAELRDRYEVVDAALKAKPLPVPNSPIKFDWSALHSLLSLSEHNPAFFPVLGGVLAELEAKSPLGWIPYALTVLSAPPPPLPLLDESAPFEGILSGVAIDEASHIKNNNDFRHYLQDMLDAAPSVGSIFAEWRLIGQKWSIETINRYSGNFVPVNVSATNGKFVIVNNVADPAASMVSAENVAGSFTPSGLVKNIAAGHTSFVALSDCLFGVMYQLFVLDILPAPGSSCENIYAPPFGIQLPLTF